MQQNDGAARLQGVHPLGKIVVAGLALVVFGGTAYGYANLRSLDDVPRDNVIDAGGETKPGEQPADGSLDILLVGRDSRADQQGNPLPGSMDWRGPDGGQFPR